MKHIFLMVIITSLYSCTRKSEDLSGLKILRQHSGPITHLDPHIASGLASSLQLSKVYESLYEVHPYNPPYEILPSLAKQMPQVSKDGKVYTIKLKKNILYHDCDCIKAQRSVRAQDFENTFKRIADPKLMSPHFSYWSKYISGMQKWYDINKEKKITDYSEDLSGVKAIDEHTLRITLNDKFSDFIYLLTGPNTTPIPKEAIAYYANDFSTKTIGTGAFKLSKYIAQSSLTFIRNDKYRKKLFPSTGAKKYQSYINEYANKPVPFLDRIEVKIIKESQTAWLNFLSGKIDYLEVAKDNFQEVFSTDFKLTKVMKEKGIVVGAGEAHSNLYYFGINQLSPALSNKKVRQAMAYAFDYEKFNKLFFNGSAVLATSFLPPGIQGNNPPLKGPYIKADIKKAKKLLMESGIKVPPLKMIVKNKTISRQTGEFFKKEMAKIGITINVEALSWSELMKDANRGKFDLFYLAWFVGLPKGPEFFELAYGPNHPGSYNRVGYHNSKFDNLFELAKKADSGQTQDRIVRQMNEIAIEDLPLLPLVHTKNYFVRQRWLRNYVPTDQIGGLEQYYDIVKE